MMSGIGPSGRPDNYRVLPDKTIKPKTDDTIEASAAIVPKVDQISSAREVRRNDAGSISESQAGNQSGLKNQDGGSQQHKHSPKKKAPIQKEEAKTRELGPAAELILSPETIEFQAFLKERNIDANHPEAIAKFTEIKNRPSFAGTYSLEDIRNPKKDS